LFLQSGYAFVSINATATTELYTLSLHDALPILHVEKSGSIIVFKDDSVASKGFTRVDDALHSIWVLNGKKEDEFYNEIDGVVFLEKRDVFIAGFEVEL